jgi:hypothetical protein
VTRPRGASLAAKVGMFSKPAIKIAIRQERESTRINSSESTSSI